MIKYLKKKRAEALHPDYVCTPQSLLSLESDEVGRAWGRPTRSGQRCITSGTYFSSSLGYPRRSLKNPFFFRSTLSKKKTSETTKSLQDCTVRLWSASEGETVEPSDRKRNIGAPRLAPLRGAERRLCCRGSPLPAAAPVSQKLSSPYELATVTAVTTLSPTPASDFWQP